MEEENFTNYRPSVLLRLNQGRPHWLACLVRRVLPRWLLDGILQQGIVFLRLSLMGRAAETGYRISRVDLARQ